MFPDEPFRGGMKEWRDLWNNDIAPFLRSQHVIPGPGMYAERVGGGTLLNTDAATAAVVDHDPGYDSYFKLTLSIPEGDENSGYRITIADGATGSSSIAVVNGMTTYQVPPYSETVTGDRLFYLRYDPPVYDGGGSLTSGAQLAIGSTDREYQPAYSGGAFYTQLGRVIFSDGVPSVVQDFTAGVADVRWYMPCGG